jgi:hypothetical protein
VPETYTPSNFFTAMVSSGPAPIRGPINAQAVESDARLVLSKSTSLLGYERYLTQARRWKGEGAALTASFEREVQTHAANAVVDTQSLTSAALRITNQFKQAGALDSMLSSWVTTIERSGPVTTAALLADLENQASFRQTLKDDDVTDEIWNSLIANLKNIDATLSVQNGKLTAASTVPNQDKRRILVFTSSPTGMPQTMSALLQRGRFERMAARFQQTGTAGLYLLPVPESDYELSDVILSGAILSVQSIAAHNRGLQDTGLAKYAGSAPIVIAAIIAVVAGVIAAWYEVTHCPGGASKSAACIAAEIIAILGIVGITVLLFEGFNKLTAGEGSDCYTMYYNFATGTWDCADGLPPIGPISH